MKTTVFLSVLLLAAALVMVPSGQACIGRILYIGITGSPDERALAEVTALLITERTGSTVKVQSFKNSEQLYRAVRQGEVSLFIENTDRAQDLLRYPRQANPKAAFDAVKLGYKRELNLTFFEQFGGSRRYAPVLSSDTVANYPALPKLMGKLAGSLNDDSLLKMSHLADSSEKLKQAARAFLKSRRLI